jgi:hypothetical protein
MGRYTRVVPRDMMNEGNLLKCLGGFKIRLDEIHEHNAYIEEGNHDEGFDICQDESSGSIHLRGFRLFIDDEEWLLERSLNIKESWPLLARSTDGEETEVYVFNDDGSLSDDLLDLIGAPRPTPGL